MGTFEKVRDITVEQLSVDADEVKMESAFIDDLGADSLDIVELIMAFEEEFSKMFNQGVEQVRQQTGGGKGYDVSDERLREMNKRLPAWNLEPPFSTLK